MNFDNNRRKELIGIGDGLSVRTAGAILASEKEILKEIQEYFVIESFQDKFEKEYDLKPSWKKELENIISETNRLSTDSPLIEKNRNIVEDELLKFAKEIPVAWDNNRVSLYETLKKLLKEKGIK